MYRNKKNISHVYSLYEQIFILRQDGHSVNGYFVVFKEKWDELTFYHPIINDGTILKQQGKKFLVAKFF